MTSLALYYTSGACSFVPHVLLETSGADYEPVMVKLHKGEQREAESLRRTRDERVVHVAREIAGARERFDELDSEVKARMNAMRGGV